MEKGAESRLLGVVQKRAGVGAGTSESEQGGSWGARTPEFSRGWIKPGMNSWVQEGVGLAVWPPVSLKS